MAKHVVEYFLRNPHASDDVEGLARWRLLDQVVRYAVEDMTRALELLVAGGCLKRITIAGSRQHYCLDPENREAAERFLRGEAPKGKGRNPPRRRMARRRS